MAELPTYCDSLSSSSTVKIDGAAVKILTSSVVGTSRPVVVTFGPLFMSLSIEQAVEFGNELIRAAHHWNAARAELVASLEAEAAPAVRS